MNVTIHATISNGIQSKGMRTDWPDVCVGRVFSLEEPKKRRIQSITIVQYRAHHEYDPISMESMAIGKKPLVYLYIIIDIRFWMAQIFRFSNFLSVCERALVRSCVPMCSLWFMANSICIKHRTHAHHVALRCITSHSLKRHVCYHQTIRNLSTLNAWMINVNSWTKDPFAYLFACWYSWLTLLELSIPLHSTSGRSTSTWLGIVCQRGRFIQTVVDYGLFYCRAPPRFFFVRQKLFWCGTRLTGSSSFAPAHAP